MTDAHVRFYAVEPNCVFSRLVYFLGKISGHDMTFVHVTMEWDGYVIDFTKDGIAFYSLAEEAEYRIPSAEIALTIDKTMLYERSIVLALTGMRLKPTSLIKKMLHLPMRDDDLLCTDFVQLLLKEPPQHMTALELYKYLGLSYGKVYKTRTLPAVRKPRQR